MGSPTSGTGGGAVAGGGAAGAGASDAGPVDLDRLDLTDLDLFSGGFPHDAFATLRAGAPVFFHRPTAHTPGGVGFWVLSRQAEVLQAVADPVTFSSERAPGAAGGGTLIEDLPAGFAAGVLLNMTDDPRHQQVRRLITPALTPRAVASMEPELRSIARALVAAAAERETCDFLTEVAAELPILATLQLLGVPPADRHRLVAWTGATLAYDDRELGQATAATTEAQAAMHEYATALIASRRADPGNDLLSALVAARLVGPDGEPAPLSDLELFMAFSLLIAAGTETTRNAIALGLAALVEHPGELDRLNAGAVPVTVAVEEILRWSSPTLYNRRTATRDATLGGQHIAAGDKVTLWWASADFDEDVFADPFRFDVGRRPNPHLAFGSRAHFCVGATLARTEIRIMVEEVLAHCEAVELAGPVRRVRTNKHAGVASMPVRLRARRARRA